MPTNDGHKIIAVDFDGTLCKNAWPEIGKLNRPLFLFLKAAQSDGAKIILWTCRVGKLLEDAIDICQKEGLIFDAVNENLPEIVEKFGSDTRKIYADIYIDDRGGQNLFEERFDIFDLYEKELNQRTVVFATLCNSYPQKAFKARSEHKNMFYAGIFTLEEIFTIECDAKFWNIFKCCECSYDSNNNGDVYSLLSLSDTDFKKFIFGMNDTQRKKR